MKRSKYIGIFSEFDGTFPNKKKVYRPVLGWVQLIELREEIGDIKIK